VNHVTRCNHPRRIAQLLRTSLAVACVAFLAGCASTYVTLSPAPQAPVCERSVNALVLWAPVWRADQKDATQREAMAADGLEQFFAESGCFARFELRRVADTSIATISSQPVAAAFTRLVVIEVRELGPVVKLLSSPTLIEGGTEAVLQVAVYAPSGIAKERDFSVHWRNGGPGVVKGVASLVGDMQQALAAALQPATAPTTVK
jgi:hypothetical protein